MSFYVSELASMIREMRYADYVRVTDCLITFTVYKIAEKSPAARAPLPVV